MKNQHYITVLFTLYSFLTLAQESNSKYRISIDFSPYTRAFERLALDAVNQSPIPFESESIATFSGEITLSRVVKNWSFGAGVSTYSYRQNFNHTFYFIPDFEIRRYQTYLEFERHGLGPHALVQWRKNNISIGLRVGRYRLIKQNSCSVDLNAFASNSSTEGIRETDITTHCPQDQIPRFDNIFELEFMTRVFGDCWLGLHLLYRGSIRRPYREQLYSLTLYQHQDFVTDTSEPPLINDITVFAPRFQLGANLRYELKWKKKGEDGLTQP